MKTEKSGSGTNGKQVATPIYVNRLELIINKLLIKKNESFWLTVLVSNHILKNESTHVLRVVWGHLGHYKIDFLSVKILSLANF